MNLDVPFQHYLSELTLPSLGYLHSGSALQPTTYDNNIQPSDSTLSATTTTPTYDYPPLPIQSPLVIHTTLNDKLPDSQDLLEQVRYQTISLQLSTVLGCTFETPNDYQFVIPIEFSTAFISSYDDMEHYLTTIPKQTLSSPQQQESIAHLLEIPRYTLALGYIQSNHLQSANIISNLSEQTTHAPDLVKSLATRMKQIHYIEDLVEVLPHFIHDFSQFGGLSDREIAQSIPEDVIKLQSHYSMYLLICSEPYPSAHQQLSNTTAKQTKKKSKSHDDMNDESDDETDSIPNDPDNTTNSMANMSTIKPPKDKTIVGVIPLRYIPFQQQVPTLQYYFNNITTHHERKYINNLYYEQNTGNHVLYNPIARNTWLIDQQTKINNQTTFQPFNANSTHRNNNNNNNKPAVVIPQDTSGFINIHQHLQHNNTTEYFNYANPYNTTSKQPPFIQQHVGLLGPANDGIAVLNHQHSNLNLQNNNNSMPSSLLSSTNNPITNIPSYSPHIYMTLTPYTQYYPITEMFTTNPYISTYQQQIMNIAQTTQQPAPSSFSNTDPSTPVRVPQLNSNNIRTAISTTELGNNILSKTNNLGDVGIIPIDIQNRIDETLLAPLELNQSVEEQLGLDNFGAFANHTLPMSVKKAKQTNTQQKKKKNQVNKFGFDDDDYDGNDDYIPGNDDDDEVTDPFGFQNQTLSSQNPFEKDNNNNSKKNTLNDNHDITQFNRDKTQIYVEYEYVDIYTVLTTVMSKLPPHFYEDTGKTLKKYQEIAKNNTTTGQSSSSSSSSSVRIKQQRTASIHSLFTRAVKMLNHPSFPHQHNVILPLSLPVGNALKYSTFSAVLQLFYYTLTVGLGNKSRVGIYSSTKNETSSESKAIPIHPIVDSYKRTITTLKKDGKALFRRNNNISASNFNTTTAALNNNNNYNNNYNNPFTSNRIGQPIRTNTADDIQFNKDKTTFLKYLQRATQFEQYFQHLKYIIKLDYILNKIRIKQKYWDIVLNFIITTIITKYNNSIKFIVKDQYAYIYEDNHINNINHHHQNKSSNTNLHQVDSTDQFGLHRNISTMSGVSRSSTQSGSSNDGITNSNSFYYHYKNNYFSFIHDVLYPTQVASTEICNQRFDTYEFNRRRVFYDKINKKENRTNNNNNNNNTILLNNNISQILFPEDDNDYSGDIIPEFNGVQYTFGNIQQRISLILKRYFVDYRYYYRLYPDRRPENQNNGDDSDQNQVLNNEEWLTLIQGDKDGYLVDTVIKKELSADAGNNNNNNRGIRQLIQNIKKECHIMLTRMFKTDQQILLEQCFRTGFYLNHNNDHNDITNNKNTIGSSSPKNKIIFSPKQVIVQQFISYFSTFHASSYLKDNIIPNNNNNNNTNFNSINTNKQQQQHPTVQHSTTTTSSKRIQQLKTTSSNPIVSPTGTNVLMNLYYLINYLLPLYINKYNIAYQKIEGLSILDDSQGDTGIITDNFFNYQFNIQRKLQQLQQTLDYNFFQQRLQNDIINDELKLINNARDYVIQNDTSVVEHNISMITGSIDLTSNNNNKANNNNNKSPKTTTPTTAPTTLSSDVWVNKEFGGPGRDIILKSNNTNNKEHLTTTTNSDNTGLLKQETSSSSLSKHIKYNNNNNKHDEEYDEDDIVDSSDNDDGNDNITIKLQPPKLGSDYINRSRFGLNMYNEDGTCGVENNNNINNNNNNLYTSIFANRGIMYQIDPLHLNTSALQQHVLIMDQMITSLEQYQVKQQNILTFLIMLFTLPDNEMYDIIEKYITKK